MNTKLKILADTAFSPCYLRRWAMALFMGITLAACSSDPDLEAAPSDSGVQVRIENLSQLPLEEVLVETGGGGQQRYFDIGPGSITDYKDFNYTYRYAFVQAVVGADTLVLQPIDYVGEERFTEGRFTFQIGLIGDPPLYMILDFRED